MRIYKQFIIFLFLMLLSFPAFAVLRISPERFELKVDNNSKNKFITDSITVQTDNNEPVRLKAYTETFDISDTGSLIIGENSTNSLLKNYIRFNPSEFVLQPGIPQKIRFTIINTDKLPNGESRVAIFLEDVKSKTQLLQNIQTGAQAKINVKTRFAVPIYVDKGQIVKSGEISELLIKNTDKNYKYEMIVKSNGNSKIRVSGAGQIIKGKSLIGEIPLESRPVQANSISKFSGELPTDKLDANSEYKFKATLIFKDQNNKNQTLTKEINFSTK